MSRISTTRADIVPALLFAAEPLAFLVVRTASALAKAIQDAERGQRGYLITRRDTYFEPYETAKERIPRLLGDLQRAILDRPDRQRRLLKLKGGLTTKMNELAAAIATRREQGFNAAQAMVNTDAGKGMDAATAMRALDPFFTTKPAGKGTGLGLPQVHGSAKQSGGHLNIYSEAGEGTTIKLYFPRDLGQESFQPRQAAAFAVTATETVLLVDDDEIVRATVASMLESLGYDVITAASGAEAISILEKGTAIELSFTDIIMPGAVSGRKLAMRATEIKPAIKVLFTSGHAGNSIVHNGRLDPGVEFLSKPYDRERLAVTVRRVLDGPAKNIEDPERIGAGDQAPSNTPPRRINKSGCPAQSMNPAIKFFRNKRFECDRI